MKPAEALVAAERKFILENFFEAHWHHQIATHPRYSDLFLQRREGREFTMQDLRDLQMWFNLAWFGREFRESEVKLVTGETASVRRFVEQGRNYNVADIEAMVEEQYKLMRAVLPLHRQLQAQEQIEVSTSPFFHPILPLLIDTTARRLTGLAQRILCALPTPKTPRRKSGWQSNGTGAALLSRCVECGRLKAR